jgi:hypothetical protein
MGLPAEVAVMAGDGPRHLCSILWQGCPTLERDLTFTGALPMGCHRTVHLRLRFIFVTGNPQFQAKICLPLLTRRRPIASL